METTISYPELLTKEQMNEIFNSAGFGQRSKWGKYVKDFDLQPGQIWIGEKVALRIFQVYDATGTVDVVEEKRDTGELIVRKQIKKDATVATIYIFSMTPDTNHPELDTLVQAMPF